MKRIALVLQAVQDGCETSLEVSQKTGISKGNASLMLHLLAKDGLIRVKQRFGKRTQRRGAPCHLYESSVAAGSSPMSSRGPEPL